jgi:uncharacterized membrane protein
MPTHESETVVILEVSPDSSPALHIAATTILYLHIGAGLVALVTGSVALLSQKGSRLHRRAGQVFVVSMLIMAAIGAAVSPFLNPPQWANVVAGLFTLYLVATGWLTVKRQNRVAIVDFVALSFAIAIALGAVRIALEAMNDLDPSVASDAAPAFMFAAIVSLAAVGDLRLILRGTLSGTQRLVRHLWRMCFGLLIATASLFLGQPQLFPESVHGTGLLFVPVIAVLGLMTFWIIRVRVAKKIHPLIPAAHNVSR